MAGVESSAQNPACPSPCPPLPLLTQPSDRLSLSPHSCNASCPSGFHGNNCSVPCECPEGPCHPVSGACQLGKVEGGYRYSNQGKIGPLRGLQKLIISQEG